MLTLRPSFLASLSQNCWDTLPSSLALPMMVCTGIWWGNCDKQHWEDEETGQEWKNSVGCSSNMLQFLSGLWFRAYSYSHAYLLVLESLVRTRFLNYLHLRRLLEIKLCRILPVIPSLFWVAMVYNDFRSLLCTAQYKKAWQINKTTALLTVTKTSLILAIGMFCLTRKILKVWDKTRLNKTICL